MHKIDIKPLSVNACWQGRRFRSKEYKTYQQAIALLLPPLTAPDGELRLEIIWGLSNKRADIDNCCKPFQDCLFNHLGVDDSRIYELLLKKEIVPKGQEFIKFKVESL